MRTPIRRLGPITGGILLVLLLAGCAGPRMIDSEVQAFAGKTAAVQGASYQIERLPSQLTDTTRATLEDMAHAALAQAGLKRSEATARYSIQVSAAVEQYVREVLMPERRRWMWRDPFYLWGSSTLLVTEPSRFRHSVLFVMRDRTSGDIVYETSAGYESGWADGARVFPVLMQAALRDYPTPPNGPRTISLPMPAYTKD